MLRKALAFPFILSSSLLLGVGLVIRFGLDEAERITDIMCNAVKGEK